MVKMILVRVQDLKPGMILGRTILGSTGQVLLRQGVELTDNYITFLNKHLIDVVYIARDDHVPVEDVISDQTRIQALNTTREVLTSVKDGAKLEIGKIQEALVTVIDELLLKDEVMINLVDIRSYSEELFSHTLNVSILAAILGIELQYNKFELTDLTTAALLHDIGLLFVSDEEYQEHPRVGAQILRKSGRVSSKIIASVIQHHENYDGTGFPKGFADDHIQDFARIIRITDTFDQLSANNRYPIEEAIEYLMAGSGTLFEPRLVRKFLECVSFYPAGTKVKLNTGEIGTVVKANKGFPTRPVVRIDQNILGTKVRPTYHLDLVKEKTYFITSKSDEAIAGERHD